MHLLVIASVIKMPFNRMRHVVVLDQSIDDRVRAATDCGSRAAARDGALASMRGGGDDFCSVTVSFTTQTVNRRSRVAFVAAAARRGSEQGATAEVR